MNKSSYGHTKCSRTTIKTKAVILKNSVFFLNKYHVSFLDFYLFIYRHFLKSYIVRGSNSRRRYCQNYLLHKNLKSTINEVKARF